jgi:ArsR family transcriptional regulator
MSPGLPAAFEAGSDELPFSTDRRFQVSPTGSIDAGGSCPSSAAEMTPGTWDITAADVTVNAEMSHQPTSVELPVLPGPRLDLARPDVADAASVAALIGDPVRASILAILRHGPHCVCEMAAALDVKQNNLSNHLARLRDAGLVRASRHKVDARWVYYERDEEAVAVATEALGRIL